MAFSSVAGYKNIWGYDSQFWTYIGAEFENHIYFPTIRTDFSESSDFGFSQSQSLIMRDRENIFAQNSVGKRVMDKLRIPNETLDRVAHFDAFFSNWNPTKNDQNG